MKRSIPRLAAALWLAVLALIGTLPSAAAAGSASLKWDRENRLFDADIRDLPLERVLALIAGETGWEVYMEPGVSQTVNTGFTRQKTGDALRLLLGRTSFALVSRTNGASRLLVYRSSPGDATRPVKVAPARASDDAEKSRRKKERVVALRPGADIEALAKRLGAKVKGRIDRLGLYLLEFPDEDAANQGQTALAQDDSVGSVEDNFSIAVPPTPEAVSLASPSPLNLRPKVVGDADRLIIGLIDTAVQGDAAKLSGFLLPAISIAGVALPGTDQPTHGTSMLTTILRGVDVATLDPAGSAVRILPVDVYGDRGSTSTFDVAAGIVAAINSGATVINLSLGGPAEAPYLQTLIRNTHDQGVLYVAAAGNEPVTAPTFPAAYPEVVAVTAGDRNGDILPYANRGAFVDVVGPGASLVPFGDQTFISYGTSTATAYVTGMTAGLAVQQQQPLASIETEVRQKLAIKPATGP